METRVKERLTGAIILVAFAVLVVPELLTGPKGPTRAAPPAVNGPPQRTYTIDLGGAAAGHPLTAESLDAQPAAAESVGVGVADAGSSPAGPPEAVESHGAANAQAAAPTSRRDVAGSHAAVGPDEAGGSHATAAAERRHGAGAGSAGHSAAAAAQASAASAAAAQAPAPPAPAAASGWSVQVGSFEGRRNAQRLIEHLRRKGFHAFMSEATERGRKWYRVRVGPVAGREAAETLLRRLHAAGHKGAVVLHP